MAIGWRNIYDFLIYMEILLETCLSLLRLLGLLKIPGNSRDPGIFDFHSRNPGIEKIREYTVMYLPLSLYKRENGAAKRKVEEEAPLEPIPVSAEKIAKLTETKVDDDEVKEVEATS